MNMKIFENSKFGEIETIVLNGQPLFNPYNVGKCLEIDEATVRYHIAKMNDKKRVVLKSELNQHLPELNIPSRGYNLNSKFLFFLQFDIFILNGGYKN
jgi:hypothetical protein